MPTISDTLRDALNKAIAAGKSANQIARECGVDQPTITRFLNGRDARGTTLEALAKYFGLELLPKKKPKQ